MILMCILVRWLKTWENCGKTGLMSGMGICNRPSGCVQWYFVPLMTFQQIGIWVDIVSKDITHVLSVRKIWASSNWNMGRKQYISGTEDFLNCITCIGSWRKLLKEVRKMNMHRNHYLKNIFMTGWRTSSLYLARPKRSHNLRPTYGRKGLYFLIFHIGQILILDIV